MRRQWENLDIIPFYGVLQGNSSLLEHIFLTFQNFTIISFFMNLWWVFLIRNHAEWEYYLISHLKAVKRIRRYRRFDISGIIKTGRFFCRKKYACIFILENAAYLSVPCCTHSSISSAQTSSSCLIALKVRMIVFFAALMISLFSLLILLLFMYLL